MEQLEFIRVVAIRKGLIKPVEFKLRDGEKGLSLFAFVNNPSPAEVIEAVQSNRETRRLGSCYYNGGGFERTGITPC
jgi:hypothetical protein